MANKTLSINDDIYKYILKVSFRDDPVLEALRKQTMKMPESNMQISPEQGQLMALLIKLMKAKNIIEIGTYTGYSTLCMAYALEDDGKIIACDANVEWTKIAKRFWEQAGVTNKIELILQKAIITLDSLIEQGKSGMFDFIFIDANKEDYEIYYEKSLILLKKGGLIAIDNVLWSGKVADINDDSIDTNIMRNFNNKLKDDHRIDISLVPISDGLTLALKK